MIGNNWVGILLVIVLILVILVLIGHPIKIE